MKTLATVCATLSLIAIVSTAVLSPAYASSDDREEQQKAYGMGIKEEALLADSPVQPSTATQAPAGKHSSSAVSTPREEPAVKTDKPLILKAKSPRRRHLVEEDTAVTVQEVRRSRRNTEESSAARTSSAPESELVRSDRETAREISPSKAAAKPVSAPVAKHPAPASRPDKIAMLSTEEAMGKKSPDDSGVSAGMILSTLLKLGLVLGLVYLTVLLLRRFSGKQIETPRSSRNLRVVDTVRLSQSSTIHVIDVKGKKLLVGCSSGQVNLIQDLGDVEEQQEVVTSSGGKFAEYLEKYSTTSGQSAPASRVAGLLRDCTAYIQKRRIEESSKSGMGADHVA